MGRNGKMSVEEKTPVQADGTDSKEIMPGIIIRGRKHVPAYEKVMMRITYFTTWIPIAWIKDAEANGVPSPRDLYSELQAAVKNKDM